MPHLTGAAQPEPSVLAATEENSLLKRSKDPNSFFRASARAPPGSLKAFVAGTQVLPEEVMQNMTSCLEGEFLYGGLHVHICSRLTDLIQSLQNGISSIHVGCVVLVMMQAEKSLGDKRLKGIVIIWQLRQCVKFLVDHVSNTSN